MVETRLALGQAGDLATNVEVVNHTGREDLLEKNSNHKYSLNHGQRQQATVHGGKNQTCDSMV